MNPSANHFWGSQGELSVHGMLERAAITVPTSSADCGDQINYCTEGFISAAMLSSAGLAYMNAHTFSARSNTYATDNLALFNTAYISAAGVPCGSVSNTTHADAATSAWTGVPVGTPLCPSSMSTAAHAACTAAWAASTPRCPETTYRETMTWGRCNAYRNACPITATYYDDSNPEFMNWWTIFYWAWWITWAPFVGFFVALISRGRTVREVIIGGFFVPTLFAIIWFSVFGGLAIKMERTAEMALQVRPDWKHAQVTCLEHYNSGGVPISPESKRLANEGYYMLTCLPKDHQMYAPHQPPPLPFLLLPLVTLTDPLDLSVLSVPRGAGTSSWSRTTTASSSSTSSSGSASSSTSSPRPTRAPWSTTSSPHRASRRS